MVKVAIVDGDEQSVNRLKAVLTRFGEENNIYFKFSVFKSGVDFVDGYTADYDFVFMEIYLPHMDGLKTAKLMREFDRDVPLVFVTNSAKHAIYGYDVDARQYLIKPIEYDTFCAKLGKDIKRAKESDNMYLIVESKDSRRKVFYTDILYIKVNGRYVSLHTKSESIEMRVSMKEMGNILRGGSFVRCDNSSMVNLMHVTSVNADGAVVNGELIPSSRNRRKVLVNAFRNYTENI